MCSRGATAAPTSQICGGTDEMHREVSVLLPPKGVSAPAYPMVSLAADLVEILREELMRASMAASSGDPPPGWSAPSDP